jgi:lipid-A-disaccharide synthase
MEKPRTVMIVAGEASGDLHGANLVREMKALAPSLAFCGVGGQRLEAEGVRLVARSSEMGVVGFTEVFSKLRLIAGVFFRLRRMLREKKPDLLILIDYPDFNLPLASAARRAGVRVFYYISPQVWAWRKNRIERIRRVVDRMAVILPFESAVYAEKGVDVEFVGHPLLDTVKRAHSSREALEAFGLRDAWPIVALLPGSREKEVMSLLAEMLGAAEILARDFAEAQFVLPLAETVDPGLVQGILRQHAVPVSVLRGRMYDAVGISDVGDSGNGTPSDADGHHVQDLAAHRRRRQAAHPGPAHRPREHHRRQDCRARTGPGRRDGGKAGRGGQGDPFRPAALRRHPG